jgi:hypothetical protein
MSESCILVSHHRPAFFDVYSMPGSRERWPRANHADSKAVSHAISPSTLANTFALFSGRKSRPESRLP